MARSCQARLLALPGWNILRYVTVVRRRDLADYGLLCLPARHSERARYRTRSLRRTLRRSEESAPLLFRVAQSVLLLLLHAIGHALHRRNRDLGFFLLLDLYFRQQHHLHSAIALLQCAVKGAGLDAILLARAPGENFMRLVAMGIKLVGHAAGDHCYRHRRLRLHAEPHLVIIAL